MFEDNIVFSCFRQGANHKPENKPCQDYARQYVDDAVQIIALSDGHGGEKYFRSQEGSRIATEIAIKSLRKFCYECKVDMLLDEVEDFVDRGPITGEKTSDCRRDFLMNHLFQNICSEWHRQIREHLANNPITEEESIYLESINATNYYINAHGDIIDYHLPSAYGCTLMAVAMTPHFWIGIHIGDGKCISFNDQGIWREPIPWDEKCFQNLTTSLSKQDFESFRYCIGRNLPVAVLIGSDGMDDSYQPMKALADCYGNYFLWPFLKMGHEKFQKNLPGLLDQISTIGSKDDMSVCCIVDSQRLPQMLKYFMHQTIRELNEDITVLSDQISDLNREHETNRQTIETYQNIIDNYEETHKTLLEDFDTINTRYDELEKIKPSRRCLVQKFLSHLSVKKYATQTDDQINLQLKQCEEEAERIVKQLDMCESEFVKASKEINPLINSNKINNNKIQRLQKESDQLSDERDMIQKRLENMTDGQEK